MEGSKMFKIKKKKPLQKPTEMFGICSLTNKYLCDHYDHSIDPERWGIKELKGWGGRGMMQIGVEGTCRTCGEKITISDQWVDMLKAVDLLNEFRLLSTLERDDGIFEGRE